jgi:hypothetical protein
MRIVFPKDLPTADEYINVNVEEAENAFSSSLDGGWLM